MPERRLCPLFPPDKPTNPGPCPWSICHDYGIEVTPSKGFSDFCSLLIKPTLCHMAFGPYVFWSLPASLIWWPPHCPFYSCLSNVLLLLKYTKLVGTSEPLHFLFHLPGNCSQKPIFPASILVSPPQKDFS